MGPLLRRNIHDADGVTNACASARHLYSPSVREDTNTRRMTAGRTPKGQTETPRRASPILLDEPHLSGVTTRSSVRRRSSEIVLEGDNNINNN